MWRALKIIEKNGILGRKEIAKELDLGEGSTRTVLNQLKGGGLIKSTPNGHSLTKKGGEKLVKRSEKLLSLDAGELTVGEKDVALIVKGAASKVKKGIEQRDEAIKAGADGATVLVFREGKLLVPGAQIELKTEVEVKLLKDLKPSEEDVIIIGTADDEATAEWGAIAAGESLSG